MSALVAVVAARLTFDAVAIVLFGSSCFVICIAPKSLGPFFAASSNRIGCLPAIACLAAISWLPFDAGVIAGNWSASVNLQFLQALALGTSGGHAWIIRCLMSFTTLVAFSFGISHLRILAAGLQLSSLSLSGHTLLQSGSLMIIHMINDALHALAGSIWLGSLILLPSCLALLDHPNFYRDAGVALQRFSRVGHVAVAIVILTGIINSVMILDRWPSRPISPYVALLALKIVLVAAMAGLALINRYLFVPRIRLDRTKTIAWIKVGTWSEVVLGAGVLTLVATFGVFDPQ